jgi:hypothetical protein
MLTKESSGQLLCIGCPSAIYCNRLPPNIAFNRIIGAMLQRVVLHVGVSFLRRCGSGGSVASDMHNVPELCIAEILERSRFFGGGGGGVNGTKGGHRGELGKQYCGAETADDFGKWS